MTDEELTSIRAKGYQSKEAEREDKSTFVKKAKELEEVAESIPVKINIVNDKGETVDSIDTGLVVSVDKNGTVTTDGEKVEKAINEFVEAKITEKVDEAVIEQAESVTEDVSEAESIPIEKEDVEATLKMIEAGSGIAISTENATKTIDDHIAELQAKKAELKKAKE